MPSEKLELTGACSLWGATPEEWALWDTAFGLTDDMLPVVSDPKARVAANSTLGDVGKVPSVYTQRREVVGLAKWTGKHTSGAQIDNWKKEKDYGFCIQTRHLRAVDVDVPDKEKSNHILDVIERILGYRLPKRWRANSGKFLVCFLVDGEYPKRKLNVDGGIIEFLANGQQFVCAGTHPSGARLQWEWPNGEQSIPTLTLEEYERLYAKLVSEFATSPPVAGSLRRAKSAAGGAVRPITDDPTAAFLIEKDLTLGGNSEKLLIECPWKEEHTGSSGDTETAYFLAGTGGFQQGHFKCFHSHCEGRSDDDFKTALGCGIEADFEVLPEPVATPGTKLIVKPPFAIREGKNRNGTAGTIMPTVDNVMLACTYPDVCRYHIAFDEFTDAIMIAPQGTAEWRPITDPDHVRFRRWFEKNGFDIVGRELMRDAVMTVADDNRIDTAQLWLNKLKWDGKERVRHFFRDYFGAADTKYIEGVSFYMWTALAGRVLKPGIKADMVPILINGQGNLKSSSIEALSPSKKQFVTLKLDDKGDNLSRLMRGRLVVELPELRGLRTTELETIKAFITQTEETWIPKYRELATTFARRCIFFGTTNNVELFEDETGNRRWLPVEAQRAKLKEIIRDREQLWAEGAHLFDMYEVMWQQAEELAPEYHDRHMVTDSWEEAIGKWLDREELDVAGKPRAPLQYTTSAEVLEQALNFVKSSINRGHENRVGKAMTKLGWFGWRGTIKGQRLRWWIRGGVDPLRI